MVKIKTSPKQKKFSKNIPTLKLKKGVNVKRKHPTKMLQNEDFISKVIWECLKNNDPEGIIEAIETHLEAININKRASARDAGIPRSTLYNSLHGKNPTIKTLAKIVHTFF